MDPDRAPTLAAAADQPRAAGQLACALAGGRLHHAWLLVGSGRQAVGFAAAVQTALVCDARGQALADPCGTCASCRAGRGGHHPDALVLRPDARRSIGVAEVRALTARLALSHQVARRRVVWLPDAAALLPAAQNALLKALEEPRPATFFLLSTPRPERLLPTVRSRCLVLRLAGPDPAAPAGLAAALAAGDEEAEARLAALPATEMARTLQALVDAAGAAGAPGPGRPEVPAESVWPRLQAAAAEWGRDADASLMATALIEAQVRDQLAAAAGAAPGPAPSPAAARRALACAEQLAWARRMGTAAQQRTFHLTRLLAALLGDAEFTQPSPLEHR